MWFLSGWKRLSTAPSQGLGRIASTSPARRQVAPFAIIVGLVGAIAAYRYAPEIRDWLLRGSNGEILVNSPTIYTRQRLVNDRLSQTRWLEDQLAAADKDFRSIDQIRSSS